jgi:hypothetical protein
MSEHDGTAEGKRLETESIEQRKLIGRAIIDGILKPAQISLIAATPVLDYDQGTGNYNQRGGGNHVQAGGNYDQALSLSAGERLGEQILEIIKVIRK